MCVKIIPVSGDEYVCVRVNLIGEGELGHPIGKVSVTLGRPWLDGGWDGKQWVIFEAQFEYNKDANFELRLAASMGEWYREQRLAGVPSKELLDAIYKQRDAEATTTH